MKKVSEYRRHAEECRKMTGVVNAEQKAMLENMAATWETLANDRERRNQQNERIAELDRTARQIHHP
jgi:hypothetical protein